jgi:hypothetical protein
MRLHVPAALRGFQEVLVAGEAVKREEKWRCRCQSSWSMSCRFQSEVIHRASIWPNTGSFVQRGDA